MNDLDLLDICARLYDAGKTNSWDHLFDDQNCYCAVQHVSGANASVIVFRGSVTALDWYNDLDEEPVVYPQIGLVHGGFFRGISEIYPTLMQAVLGDVYVVGHSLGAARAFICGGLMIANGRMPKAILGWGSPRPGFARLSEIIATCPDARWYRNREDPVTFVPWRLGDFKHCGEMRQVNAPPPDGDSWGPLSAHHLSLYRAGMIAAEAVPVG